MALKRFVAFCGNAKSDQLLPSCGNQRWTSRITMQNYPAFLWSKYQTQIRCHSEGIQSGQENQTDLKKEHKHFSSFYYQSTIDQFAIQNIEKVMENFEPGNPAWG